jgi:hypothetical protein
MTWLDDLQWRLARAGVRGLGVQIADQFNRAVRGEGADVWETATTEDPAAADTPPECAWCPICRAIRAARNANPDLASRVGDTADAAMSAAFDMVAAVESVLSGPPGPASTRRPSAAGPSATGPSGPAAPAGTAPAGTAPADAVPADSAPADTVPADAAPPAAPTAPTRPAGATQEPPSGSRRRPKPPSSNGQRG